MAEFVSEKDTSNPLLNRSSQKTIDLLESISSIDMALAVPFLRITRIDPQTRKPTVGVPPLNVFLQKTPRFGSSIEGRFSERPPSSLELFSIATKQNYGHIIEQHIEMKIIAHRPSAVFDSPDSVWSSLITPGDTHLVEYGWAGSSKNGLVNGFGFDDDDALGGRVFIPSQKAILFSTYYYTFSIKNTGEIEFSIKGMQNGNLVFRQIQLGDVLESHDDVQESRKSHSKTPAINRKEKSKNNLLRKKLQTLLSSLLKKEGASTRKGKKTLVKFVDILNVLLAKTITTRCTDWGYDKIDLIIGRFNPNIAPTSKEFIINGDEIAEFMIPFDVVKKVIEAATRKGADLTIQTFIESLLSSSINSATTWAPGELDEKSRLSTRLPQIMVKVIDESTLKTKRLKITIFDSVRDLIALFPEETRLYGDEVISRKKIKEKLMQAKVPFISLGKANSFIIDSNFEVEMDPQIQRAKIDAAAKFLKTRSEVTSKSLRDIVKDSPNEYHQIFSSAIRGTITMIGNFAFDTFASMWVDFQVNIWDGPFVVRQRTDTITSSGFETMLEVYSEGTDPLNTKRRLSKEQVDAMEEVQLADQAARESKKRNIDMTERQKAARERLKASSVPKPTRPKNS